MGQLYAKLGTVVSGVVSWLTVEDIRAGTVEADENLTLRNTLRLTFVSEDGSLVPVTRQPVLFGNDEDGDTFGGTVDSVASTNIPGSSAVFSEIVCVGHEAICARRYMDPTTYTGKNLGEVAKEIADFLVEEGLTYSGSSILDGPVLDTTSFDYTSCYERLDRICELASTDTDTYVWDILPDKVVRVYKQSTHAAPWSGDDDVLAKVTKTTTREKLANVVAIRLSKYVSDFLSEDYPGDEISQSFELVNPIATAPFISCQIDGVTSDQSVGILGVDTGKQWYWNAGSNRITQDESGAILDADDRIYITYFGYITQVVTYENVESILECQEVEGGSGRYEKFIESDTPMNADEALVYVTAVATAYGMLSTSVEIESLRAGLRAGQSYALEVEELGVDDTFLIESVTLTDDENAIPKWRARLASGALLGDWRNAFMDSSGRAAGVSSQLPPDEATPASDAPNVTSAWLSGLTAVYIPYGHDPKVSAIAGVITPPSGTDLTNLQSIIITVAAGGSPPRAYQIAEHFFEAGTPHPFSVATDEILFSSTSFGIEFACQNPNAKITASPYTTTVPVTAPSVASSTLVEDSRISDGQGGLVATLAWEPVIANNPLGISDPLWLTLWTDYDQGDEFGVAVKNKGTFPVLNTGEEILIPYVWATLLPSTTLTLHFKFGQWSGDVIPSGAGSKTMTLNGPGAPGANWVTAASLTTATVTGDGGARKRVIQATATLPVTAAHPEYKASRILRTVGRLVGSVFTASPNYARQEVLSADSFRQNKPGVTFSTSTAACTFELGPWEVVQDTLPGGGDNPDTHIKLEFEVATALDGGTWALQTTCWAGSTAQSYVDMRESAPDVAPPAIPPDIATATATTSHEFRGWNSPFDIASGHFDVPSVTETAAIKYVLVQCKRGTGSNLEVIEVARVEGPFTGGATVDYKGLVGPGDLLNARSGSIILTPFNADNVPAVTPKVIAVTFSPISITGVAGSEVGPVKSDGGGGATTKIRGTLAGLSEDTIATFWLVRGDGSSGDPGFGVEVELGWYPVTTAAPYHEFDLQYLPTKAAETAWVIKATPYYKVGPSPAGVLTGSFTVAQAPAPGTTWATGATITTATVLTDRGVRKRVIQVTVTAPTVAAQPSYKAIRILRTVGKLVGSTFTATTDYNPNRQEVLSGDSFRKDKPGVIFSALTAAVTFTMEDWLTVPATLTDGVTQHPHSHLKLEIEVESSRDGGTWTIQTCFAASAPQGYVDMRENASDATSADAPNVTSFTASVTYGQVGGSPVFYGGGSFAMPTPGPAEVRVVGVLGSEERVLSRFTFGSSYPSSVNWSSEPQSQNTAAEAWVAYARAYNKDGKLTAGAPSASMSVAAAAGPLQPPANVASCSVTEPASSRYRGTDTNTRTKLRVTVNFTANQGNQNVTIWYSGDNGSNWQWIGWFPVSTAGAGTVDFERLVPFSNTSVKVAAKMGSISGDPNYTITNSALVAIGAVQSGTYAFVGYSVPASTGCSITVTNVAGLAPTTANIYMGANSLGNPYAQINLSIATPGGSADPYAWYYFVWVRWVDASGNEGNPGGVSNNPGWQPHQQFENLNAAKTYSSTIFINYPTSTVYNRLQLACWAISRKGTASKAPYTGDSEAVLHSAFSGFQSLTILVGNGPTDTLNLKNTNPLTLGDFLGKNVTTGEVELRSQNVGTSMAPEWNFEQTPVGYIIQNNTPTNMDTNWGANGTVEIRNDGGHSGANYARLYWWGTYSALYRQFPLPQGEAISVSCAVRASNHTGSSHVLYLHIQFLNSAGSEIGGPNYSFASANTTGSPPVNYTGWTDGKNIVNFSRILAAPAGTVKVQVSFELSFGEPSGSYWDVDSVLVQGVTNQTGNQQTATQIPQNSGGDYSALKVSSQVDLSSAYYGKSVVQLFAPDGNSNVAINVSNTSVSVQAAALSAFGGLWLMGVTSAGPITRLWKAGVPRDGFTGTVVTNAGTKDVIAGIIMN